MARILRAAEAAKRHLSDHPYARIEEEYLTETDGQADPPVAGAVARRIRTDDRSVRRGDPGRRSTSRCESADLTASQVEEILLVGGATRTPMIRRRLHEVFASEPRGEVDADLCVAMGAAIQGAAIAGAEVSAVLVDVTPYTFGTSALGELEGEFYPYQYVPIIARNTRDPGAQERRRSSPWSDDQTAVDVRIYQGENADALENIQIGEFRVEGLSKAPAGNPVMLDLALDRDGILHVAAQEKNTGLERRISIDQAVARYGAAELQQARERIGSLFGQDDADGPMGGDAAGPAMPKSQRCWTRPARNWMRPPTRIGTR